jgi:hypothetical protein
VILPLTMSAPLTTTFTPLRSVNAVSHSRVCGLTLGCAENGIHAAAPYFVMIGAFEVGGTQAPAQQASTTQATLRSFRIGNVYSLGDSVPNPLGFIAFRRNGCFL